jgi:hypothetical protein
VDLKDVFREIQIGRITSIVDGSSRKGRFDNDHPKGAQTLDAGAVYTISLTITLLRLNPRLNFLGRPDSAVAERVGRL